MDIYPTARRVLLTAYADTDAAIERDQRRRPRPLPAQAVGPAGGEALPGDRRALLEPGSALRRTRAVAGDQGHRPPLVGAVLEVRDFLARNQVPYRWYACDEPEGSRLLAAAGPPTTPPSRS